MGLFKRKKQIVKPEEQLHGAHVIEQPESQAYDPRVGFILLEQCGFDWEKFKNDLQTDWGIPCDGKVDQETLTIHVDPMMVVCSFMPNPVPSKEAVDHARNNFLYPDVVKAAQSHKAHLVLSVMNGKDAITQSLLFTMVAATLLKQDHATALYQYPTVIPAEFYIHCAQDIKTEALPVLDWIYFGIYADAPGYSGFSYGLRYFGREEIEVIHTHASPEDLYSMLISVASYVLESNTSLHSGQTVGYSADEKMTISLTPGIAVDGNSLKIAFHVGDHNHEHTQHHEPDHDHHNCEHD